MNYKKQILPDLYPVDIFEKLEFNKIIELLSQKCKSSLGKQLANNLQINGDPDMIETLLKQVYEFKQLLAVEEGEFPSNDYYDLTEEFNLLRISNATLSEAQIFKLYKVLRTIQEIQQYFNPKNEEQCKKYLELVKIIQELTLDKQALHKIKFIIDDDGKVRSDASKELAQIRKEITEKYRELDRKFNAILNEYKRLGFLHDSLESTRNGRRVLAVLAENKRKIKGLLLDESNTGNTCFMEPEVTLLINNDIFELQQAEKREIFKILRELTAQLQPFTPEFKHNQTVLANLDFIRAKALLAWDLNAHAPKLSISKNMELFNAKHPLLFLKNKTANKPTIPLNLELNIANRILVVSGPNAGGKSVMLKTVGLLQLMLQAGMLVPVSDNSTMMVFQHIFVDIGDEQSIENDLSTYSSHLKNMKHFTDFSDAKTLLLIDEFGAGTDPSLGGAIAEAVLQHFIKKFCYGIITTHYSNLKVFASHTVGVLNGCMTFDYNTLSPLYKLSVGNPGSSFAFELAVKSALNPQIIEYAKSKVDVKYKEFDELLSNLQKEKQELAERERKISEKEQNTNKLIETYTLKNTELDQKKKKILLEAQEQALLMVQEANRKFENLIKEWNEKKGIKTDEKQVIKKIKQELETEKDNLTNNIEQAKDKLFYKDITKPIDLQQSVRLRNGREVGIVVELRNKVAVVEFENVRTTANKKDLVAVEPVLAKTSFYNNPYNTLQAKSEFQNNIDIRGMRREEAMQLIVELIDKALIFSANEVKVIHGLGNGILRNAVREYAKKIKQVTSVKDEEPQYGGSGVSIIAFGD